MAVLGYVPLYATEENDPDTIVNRDLVTILEESGNSGVPEIKFVVNENNLNQYLPGLEFDFHGLLDKMYEDLTGLANLFEPGEGFTEFYDKIFSLFCTKVSFATSRAMLLKYGNSTAAGLFFGSKGSWISVYDRRDMGKVLKTFRHEFGGHQMHYTEGTYTYAVDNTIVEILSIFMEQKLGSKETYPWNPHKQAYEMLEQIRAITPFDDLPFKEQWEMLNKVKDYRQFFIWFDEFIDESALARLKPVSNDLISPPSLPLPTDHTSLRWWMSSREPLEIDDREWIREHSDQLSNEVKLLYKKVGILPKVLRAYNVPTHLQSYTIYREICMTMGVNGDRKDFLALLDKELAQPKTKALNVLELLLNHHNAEMYILRTPFSKRNEFYVAFVKQNEAYDPSIQLDSEDNSRLPNFDDETNYYSKSFRKNRSRNDYYTQVAMRPTSVLVEGFFWFDNSGMQCEIIAHDYYLTLLDGLPELVFSNNPKIANPVYTKQRREIK
ncbi:MAG: hypothetical protein ABIJ34_01325 [archaeon]